MRSYRRQLLGDFRFPDRRSPFDLDGDLAVVAADITWGLADLLDGPTRPRTAGPIEQIRRSLICLSAYLRDCDSFVVSPAEVRKSFPQNSQVTAAQ